LGIEPGQKLQVLACQHRIEFLPAEAPQSLRGFLPGLDSAVPRDGDRMRTWWTPADGWNAMPTTPTPTPTPAIEVAQDLLVASLTLFEVFKRILQQRTEADALDAAALMRQGRVVALSDTLALGAARLSFDLGLGQASTMLDALQSMQRTA